MPEFITVLKPLGKDFTEVKRNPFAYSWQDSWGCLRVRRGILGYLSSRPLVLHGVKDQTNDVVCSQDLSGRISQAGQASIHVQMQKGNGEELDSVRSMNGKPTIERVRGILCNAALESAACKWKNMYIYLLLNIVLFYFILYILLYIILFILLFIIFFFIYFKIYYITY